LIAATLKRTVQVPGGDASFTGGIEITNEELQSTNEELQSTNEELTTSKEEIKV